MQLNIQSLRYKVAEIEQIIDIRKPLIFGLSETEINENVVISDLKISVYQLILSLGVGKWSEM